jgi:hypothetical protein
MLHLIALVRTEVSQEHIASNIRAKRISGLGTTLAVTETQKKRKALQLLVTANAVSSSLILFALMTEAIRSSETSVLTRATWHHIPEEGIFLSVKVYPGVGI